MYQPENPPENTEQPISVSPVRASSGSFLRDVVIFAIVAICIVLPIRLFVVQPFIVDGSSMDPTFETNDYLLVNQLSYHFGDPARGQVIIFKYPKNPSVYFIKRVIGLPGEEVKITGATVTICKNPAENCSDSFILDEPYVAPRNASENEANYTLGTDEYFVMGDNRSGSSDSRAWGPVPRELIVGTPIIRLYPLSEINIFPGDYKEAH